MIEIVMDKTQGGFTKYSKLNEALKNWPELEAALTSHDPVKVYNLLSERYKPPLSGQILLKLIHAIPDWPKAEDNVMEPRIEKVEKIKKKVEKVEVDNPTNRVLTDREFQILQCASHGFSVRETAQDLNLAENTVKTHRRNIASKLHATSTFKAVCMGTNAGWF